ncbi:MAG: hydroxysqualene dehydroxylase HpnE [Pseudomonadota bacterium]
MCAAKIGFPQMSKPKVKKHIAVIGAGWAGCAAAVELSGAGHRVSLLESARTLGGRARAVELNGKTLDNGQHILLGAYSETLRLMRAVGIDFDAALLRLPLQMRYPAGSGGMDFIAPRLPAPLHLLVALLRASGLQRDDKMALARFSTTARWMDWRLNNDCSVSEILARFDQTARLTQLMWRPLCIAALNTPPERASAQVFLNVLRDSLGAKRAASDMLIPRVDLTALFPQHAAAFIEKAGGDIQCGVTVKAIRAQGAQWQLDINGATESTLFDGVVIATQAPHASALLDGLTDVQKLPDFDYEPITTCYLQYASEVRLEHAFFALIDDAASKQFGQFVFDRGQLDAAHAGLLAVVVSASGEAIELGHEALAAAIAQQLATVLQRAELNQPQWSKVITEKRATFACAPALQRPGNSTGLAGLVIAGDYTASDYPATLESAVRSGVGAAKLLLTN